MHLTILILPEQPLVSTCEHNDSCYYNDSKCILYSISSSLTLSLTCAPTHSQVVTKYNDLAGTSAAGNDQYNR